MGKIAVFGGAFDPFHNGHVAAIRLLLKHSAADQILVVPCGDRPDKPEITKASDRYQMAKLGVDQCFSQEPRVVVSDLQSSGVVGYATIDLIDYLNKSGADSLEFVIGSELIGDLPQWREADRLRGLVDFLALVRPGIVAQRPPPVGWRVRILPPFGSDGVELSSSQIRAQAKGGGEWLSLVPKSVGDYAVSHGLY